MFPEDCLVASERDDGTAVAAVPQVADVPADVWGFASGMWSSLRSDVSGFVEALAAENRDLVDDIKDRSAVVAASVQHTIQSAKIAATDPNSSLPKLIDQIEHGMESLEKTALGQSVQSLGGKAWSNASNFFTAMADDNVGSEKSRSVSPETGRLSPKSAIGLSAQISSVQRDVLTYMTDPDSKHDSALANRYKMFVKDFEVDDSCTSLKEVDIVNAFYEELVVSKGTVPEKVFFARYLFRVRELEGEESRRIALLSRVNNASSSIDLTWDESEIEDHKTVLGVDEPGAETLWGSDIGQIVIDEPNAENIPTASTPASQADNWDDWS